MKLVVDSHTHTLSSGHAYSTVTENAREAGLNGMEMFAMTDHGPSLEGASSILHFWNIKMIPETICGVRVVKGAEANIIDYSGKIDLPVGYLKRLDFTIASYHEIVIEPASIEEHTEGLVNALKNPYVDAIAHPGNPFFPVDIDRVVRAAAEYSKLIEINNNSFLVRKGSEENCKKFVKACRKYGVRVTCGSDAHICFDVGRLDHVYSLLMEADFPEELVICSSAEKFEMYLKERNTRTSTGFEWE